MIPGPKGRLQAILQLPDGFDRTRDRCTVVILMHGIMPNPVTIPLPHFARALVNSGYAALRFFFYGNWGSDGTNEEVTVPGEIEDARAVYRLVRSWPFAAFTVHRTRYAGMASSSRICRSFLQVISTASDTASSASCGEWRYPSAMRYIRCFPSRTALINACSRSCATVFVLAFVTGYTIKMRQAPGFVHSSEKKFWER